MFGKIFAFLALVAVAFANPKPDPQVLAYSSPVVTYPVAGVASYASPYAPVVSAYSSPYVAAPAVPYAYGGYYVR